MEPSASSPAPRRSPRMRLRREEALQSVLEELQRVLDELREDGLGASLADPEGAIKGDGAPPDNEEGSGSCACGDESLASRASDSDVGEDQLCDIIKSTFEPSKFFHKIDEIQKSLYQNDAVEQDTTWNIIKAVDLWEYDDSVDGYVIVNNDDATEAMAFFIATYISSLKTANEWSPDQIKKVLKKTFSARKRKGKLRKAWDGTKAIYNVVSWSATAVGVISKFL
ncbi:hypothetical protein GUJ93_ZPchr0009g1562 [Zizania palustris]|uniref:Uncharacterized protein n=1 Tax=Zizania palustris TaxID=103762 RepID=A0A8J5VMA2_ZIZPA|nr:hypothetical protein GUJ93_ZPchr0009g1562 [Zizania palustris]